MQSRRKPAENGIKIHRPAGFACPPPPWRTGPFPTGRGMLRSAGTDPLSLCLTRRPGSGGGRCRSFRDPANCGAAVARSFCSTGVWEELPCLGMRGAGGTRCGGRVRLALLSVSSVKRVGGPVLGGRRMSEAAENKVAGGALAAADGLAVACGESCSARSLGRGVCGDSLYQERNSGWNQASDSSVWVYMVCRDSAPATMYTTDHMGRKYATSHRKELVVNMGTKRQKGKQATM
ncbi:hypothetical protein VDGL01_07029 [Verticillium dahliae]